MMNVLPVLKSPQARADILDHAAYLGERSESLSDRFVDEVEAAFALIGANPELGTRRDSQSQQITGLRSWTIAAFPNHVLFYRICAGSIEIVRLLHGSRDIERALEGE